MRIAWYCDNVVDQGMIDPLQTVILKEGLSTSSPTVGHLPTKYDPAVV